MAPGIVPLAKQYLLRSVLIHSQVKQTERSENIDWLLLYNIGTNIGIVMSRVQAIILCLSTIVRK